MKKYRHKQTDQTIELVHKSQGFWEARLDTGIDIKYVVAITDEELNNTKIWEEIVKNNKDYEILSFLSSITNIFKRIDNSNMFIVYYTGMSLSEEHLIENPSYTIHSVKRLSDGVVFTIGDNIKYITTWLTYHTLLNSFTLTDNHIYINNSIELKDLILYKNPILVTEDGVEIFGDNTTVYGLADNFKDTFLVVAREVIGSYKSCCITWFSTETKRDEYIKRNKKVLSIADLEKLYNSYRSSCNYSIYASTFKDIIIKQILDENI